MKRPRINWSEQDQDWPYDDSERSNWLIEIARTHRKNLKKLNYSLLSDEELLKINRDYLNHDTYTDIITFDYSDEKGISGEIFISYERVEENAKNNGVSDKEEMMRVIAHGLLHLCGLKDKQEPEVLAMREAEEEALKLWVEVSRGT
jgi:rRNA maturation RNase YbeY